MWWKSALLFFWVLGLSCSKGGGGSSGPKIVKLTGSVSIPAQFKVYPIFDSTARWTSVEYLACPANGNSSVIEGPITILHTQNSCSDSQWIYFSEAKTKDLSAYANGAVEARIQATAGSMVLNAFIQDGDTKVSNTLNLANYGFDASKSGVEQKVVIPIKDFTQGVSGFNLKKMSRVIQFNVSCQTANCYLSIYKLQWRGGSEDTTNLTSICPRPGGCIKPNNGSYARFYMPTSYGWKALTPSVAAVTDADGKFSGNFDVTAIEDYLRRNIPIVLAFSEPSSDFTLMYSLSIEEFATGSAELDVNLESTLAAMLQCPGGVYPPPSGAYCVSSPKEKRDNLEKELVIYFEDHPVVEDTLDDLATATFDDSEIIDALQENLGLDKSDMKSNKISEINAGYPIPAAATPAMSSSAIPKDLPAGSYTFKIEVCGAGTCQSSKQNIEAPTNAAAEIAAQIKSAFDQSKSSCGGDVKCADSYSSFNGSSFYASRQITSCSGDICAFASIHIGFSYNGASN